MKYPWLQYLGLIILLSLVIAIAYKGTLTMNQSIEVLFPISVLKDGQELLNPDNTETVWEYYLLENLACGLVRDSKTSPMGYVGCLAERFYRQDIYTWIFEIRDLKWSNGEQVTESEIVNWINSLKSSDRRHIRYLKLADRIHFDGVRRLLTIHFPFEMDATILHELSLADAALMPTDYRSRGWVKTVGPYYVNQWSKSKNILELKANKYSPFYREKMPQSARLRALKDGESRSDLFKNSRVDIVPLGPDANPIVINEVLPNAPQVFISHPISIMYFHFNKQLLETQNIANREIFAFLIGKVRKSISDHFNKNQELVEESQMIPKGFAGRINKVIEIQRPKTWTISKININLPPSFKDNLSFLNALETIFKNNGINVEVSFLKDVDQSKNWFATTHIFVGNQLDASGSWAFLTSEANGKLRPWISEFMSEYQDLFKKVDLGRRQESILRIHEQVLEKCVAVPFIVGSQRYLFSENIDFSSWNRFDARLRLNDLSWK